MSDAFSSHSTDPINRTIDLAPAATPEDLDSSLEEAYEVLETVAELNKHDFRRVALQFPDELLRYSVPLYRLLKAKVPAKEFYVMADTSYGSCCVDEVAAQHVDADAVVHYGHACLSPTTRLPAIYVFPRLPVDVADCARSFVEVLGYSNAPLSVDKREMQTVIIILDLAYHYQADSIFTAVQAGIPPGVPIHMWRLEERFIPPTKTHSSVDQKASTSHQTAPQHQHQRHRIPDGVTPERCTILYVGGESLALNNVLMANGGAAVYSYDPSSRSIRMESLRSNRLLMRRYATVHKARDADVFGILVGTLGVANYLTVITHLRRIIAQSRKKSYTVSVGKLNPSKLANFMEIECFVLVACPENSIVDAKEFLRPIITPHELIAALSPEVQWSAPYTLNFDDVLVTDAQLEIEKQARPCDDDDNDDRPTFSLVSGTYRDPKRYGNGRSAKDLPAITIGSSDALSTRTPDGMVLASQSAAAQYLQARTFKGLERKLDQDEPTVLEQGRSGIAQGYSELI